MCALIIAIPFVLLLVALAVVTQFLPVIAIPLYALGVVASLGLCLWIRRIIVAPLTAEQAAKEARRRERRRYNKPEQTLGYYVRNGAGVFMITVGFYIGNFSQLLRYWDYYFGGFKGIAPLSDPSANYFEWVGFCVSWFVDNSLWSFSQIFHQPAWSPIMPTNVVAEVLVWAFNIGLIAVATSTGALLLREIIQDDKPEKPSHPNPSRIST